MVQNDFKEGEKDHWSEERKLPHKTKRGTASLFVKKRKLASPPRCVKKGKKGFGGEKNWGGVPPHFSPNSKKRGEEEEVKTPFHKKKRKCVFRRFFFGQDEEPCPLIGGEGGKKILAITVVLGKFG